VVRLRARDATRLRRDRERPGTGRLDALITSTSFADRVILKQDRFFVVSAKDGSIDAANQPGDGLWFGDTRILSSYRLLVAGADPSLRSHESKDSHASFEQEARGLNINRSRFIERGLRERITLTNPGSRHVETEIALVFTADFAAMFAVRGMVRDLPAPTSTAVKVTDDGLLLTRENPSNAVRVTVQPPGLRHRVSLEPGEIFSLQIDVAPEPNSSAIEFDSGLARIEDVYRRWDADSISIRTDNPALNELLEQSLSDLRMLCDLYPTGIYPTGGLPWFAVPFGRDPLITSMQMLPANPEIARGVLRYQAANQGRRIDEDSEEQPGKILHEVRDGEVVDRGFWPHILFGTIDATALFICALFETVDWTGDAALLDELWPAAEAALEWCERYGDSDADGYIEYRGARARNQGWKDSDDSLTNADGSDVSRPAALCEVQAYLYRALLGMGRRRPELKERAAALRERFDRDFWMPEANYVAQALDGSKHRVEAITSNPGHCLWAGILPHARAAQVAARLISPEMFSGWGVRTLSANAINYDRRSYHNGSVWPFDSALAAAGLRKSGFPVESELIARAVLEAGMAFPLGRLPELYCGDAREPGRPPAIYWNSCTPQAWSAGCTYLLIATLLGLEADASIGRLRIAPLKTPLWGRMEVSGLHFAGHRLDFEVLGERVKAGNVPGGIRLELA
jgi:glycogen debranching enzyme